MKKINSNTKTHKLLNALKDGEIVTASQAEKRFGIKNIRAEATRIRQAGYAVYANRKVSGNHREITTYEIGMPSRKIVAAGYLARKLGLV